MNHTIETTQTDYKIKKLETEAERWQCFHIYQDYGKQIMAYANKTPHSEEWYKASFQEYLNEPHFDFYGMFDEKDNLVGWTRMLVQNQELGQIYVSPQSTEPWVAEELLHFTEQKLGQGAFLWLWELDYNTDSLFQKNGWYFSGQQKELKKVSDIFVMKKFEFFGK